MGDVVGAGAGAGAPAAVELRAGPPGRLLALLAPIAAVALVVLAARRDGLAAGPSDVVAPAVIAVLTVLGGALLGWRAWTQRALLDADGLRCRNLLVTFEADWDLVESLRVQQRGPWVTVDLVFTNLRRGHRIGAATRFSGPSADELLVAVEQLPPVALRLERSAP